MYVEANGTTSAHYYKFNQPEKNKPNMDITKQGTQKRKSMNLSHDYKLRSSLPCE